MTDGAPHPLHADSRRIAFRIAAVLVAGIALYVVLPALVAVLGAWPRLATLNAVWLGLAAVAEVGSFTCNVGIQRVALQTKAWFPVATSWLANNAVAYTVPGGLPLGAAVQYRMLSESGLSPDAAAGGISAGSLLNIGGLLALPLLTLPVTLGGTAVPRGLRATALLGVAGFALYAVLVVVLLATDRPLQLLANALQRLRNLFVRDGDRRVHDLDRRFLAERDAILVSLGANWRRVALFLPGRLFLDYLCLLAVLRATGSNPRPPLVLLAYSMANILAMLPVTPGGIGITEAGLTGMLALAGIAADRALLATLAYRIGSYWMPVVSGLPAYLLFRHRYRSRHRRATG